MINRSMVEQVKCRWREFRREPSAFFWVVFMPILWMLALGFAFSKPHPETYGIGWQAPAHPSAWTEALLHALRTDPQLKFRDPDAEDLRTHMMRGEISVIVTSHDDNKVSYSLDQNNPEAVRAQKYLDDVVQRFGGRQDVIAKDFQTVQVEGGRYVDFLIPGLLGLSIMTSSLFGVGMTIVSNRKENLLKRYLATPMRAYEYIVSHLCGRMIVLLAEFSAVMITGFAVFHFKVYGNFLSFFVFAVLGAAAFTSIALLCAARTRSIPMISGVTNLISLPMMMLSGVFFSKNNFPEWLIKATGYLPLTALNDGLRRIALEGQPLHTLGFEIAVLAAYIVIPAVITQRLFKWY
ncbi:MAG: ABC transporter permease [Chitinophagaceae bacterium]|nr:ABC transporter permease [Oligoflexus sp.]